MEEEYFLFPKEGSEPIPDKLYSLEEGVTLLRENTGWHLEYHEAGNWDDALKIEIRYQEEAFYLEITSTHIYRYKIIVHTTQQIKTAVEKIEELFLDGDLEDADLLEAINAK